MWEHVWEVVTFQYPFAPWWGELVVGFLWLYAIWYSALGIDGVRSRVAWARRKHEQAKRPFAYYEEHNGVYAVFLPDDMHKAIGPDRKLYREHAFVVVPTMTFAPDSVWRWGDPVHTGTIPDMIDLFAGWNLRRANVRGADFFVPCAKVRPMDQLREELEACPLVEPDKARAIVEREIARYSKTPLTTWWYFWRR